MQSSEQRTTLSEWSIGVSMSVRFVRGTMVGNWGGYDVSGLIGEVNGTNDYAFAMNTFEQAGALVPMVRYDDRFARDRKVDVERCQCFRLFYSNYLPDSLQDSEQWAHQYDPNSTIAYEALRQSRMVSVPLQRVMPSTADGRNESRALRFIARRHFCGNH